MKLFLIVGGLIAAVVIILYLIGKREAKRLDFDAPHAAPRMPAPDPKASHAPVSPAKDFMDAPEPPEPGLNLGKKDGAHGKR